MGNIASGYTRLSVSTPTDPDLSSDGTKKYPNQYECNYDYCDGLKYAKLSNLAYFSYKKVQNDLPQYNLKAVAKISNRETDTEGFIAADPAEQLFVVSMRGTEPSVDIPTDVNINSEPIIPGSSECALGQEQFVKSLNSVYDKIESHLKPHLGKKEIYLTGHSQGGALVCLIAYRLVITYPECKDKLRILVYGCPPVGDEAFVATLRELKAHVITCEDDSVSNGTTVNQSPYYKPSGVHLLPGGGHLLSYYIDIMRERIQRTNARTIYAI